MKPFSALAPALLPPFNAVIRTLLPLVTGVSLMALLPALPTPCQAQDFKARMRTVLNAWETLNPAKVAPFYSQEPGRLFFDVAPLKYTGWSEYADGATKLFADLASITFTLGDDAQAQKHGNFAWGAVTVRTDVVMKDGTKQSYDARWTTIWEQRGKEWIISHDHYSRPVP